MTTRSEKTYQVHYQLGARGPNIVTTQREAARELAQSIRAANDGGDLQDIWVEDNEGNVYKHPYDTRTGKTDTRKLELVQQ